jgi:hypothetical protein
MCPLCAANAALIVAGVTSTGGLTALAVKKLFLAKKTKTRRINHDKESNRASRRIAS